MRLAILAAPAAAVAFTWWMASRRQQRTLSAEVDRLTQAAAVPPETAFGNLGELPVPVARYLRRSLPQRQSIRLVRLRQVGTLRADAKSERWMPFEAEHLAAPHATGFLWNARVAIYTLLHLRVRDAFIEGRGSGHVSLQSAFTVAADSGTPEMNSGSLHRFLAEAVWYPTALLPSPKVRWNPIDANRTLATLTGPRRLRLVGVSVCQHW